MDRFPRRQFMGRSPGPPASAAADGLAQGMPYTAIVQAAPVNGECAVTIPALHLSETFSAHVGSVTPHVGESVLVLFDEQKRPWIVAGGISTEVETVETKVTSLEASRTADEAKISTLEAKVIELEEDVDTDSGWIAVTFAGAWKNEPAGRATTAYRKIGNIVYLRGSLFGGAEGSEAFSLPVGFRPPADLFAAGGGFSTVGAPCSVVVKATGVVVIFKAASATQASVDGISFTID